MNLPCRFSSELREFLVLQNEGFGDLCIPIKMETHEGCLQGYVTYYKNVLHRHGFISLADWNKVNLVEEAMDARTAVLFLFLLHGELIPADSNLLFRNIHKSSSFALDLRRLQAFAAKILGPIDFAGRIFVQATDSEKTPKAGSCLPYHAAKDSKMMLFISDAKQQEFQIAVSIRGKLLDGGTIIEQAEIVEGAIRTRIQAYWRSGAGDDRDAKVFDDSQIEPLAGRSSGVGGMPAFQMIIPSEMATRTRGQLRPGHGIVEDKLQDIENTCRKTNTQQDKRTFLINSDDIRADLGSLPASKWAISRHYPLLNPDNASEIPGASTTFDESIPQPLGTPRFLTLENIDARKSRPGPDGVSRSDRQEYQRLVAAQNFDINDCPWLN